MIKEKAVKAFKTVAFMVADPNLLNQEIVLTKGFHGNSLKGSGRYYIGNLSDDVDGMTVFNTNSNIDPNDPSAGTLKAKLLNDGEVNLAQLGAEGGRDNKTADSQIFYRALSYCSDNGLILRIPSDDKYYIEDGILLNPIENSDPAPAIGGQRKIKINDKITIKGDNSSIVQNPQPPTSILVFEELQKGVNAIQVGDIFESESGNTVNILVEDLTIQYKGDHASLHIGDDLNNRVIDDILDAEQISGFVITRNSKRDSMISRCSAFGFKYGAGLLFTNAAQEPRVENSKFLQNYVGINVGPVNGVTFVNCTCEFNALNGMRITESASVVNFIGGLIEGTNANFTNNGNLKVNASTDPLMTNKKHGSEIYMDAGTDHVTFYSTFFEFGIGNSPAASNGQIRFLNIQPIGVKSVEANFYSCKLNALNGDLVTPIYIFGEPEDVINTKLSFINSKFAGGVGNPGQTKLAQIGEPVGSPPEAFTSNEIITGPAQFGYTNQNPGSLTINRDLNSRSLKIEGDNLRLLTSRAKNGDSREDVSFSEIQGFRGNEANPDATNGGIKFLTKDVLDTTATEKIRIDREGNIIPKKNESIDIGGIGFTVPGEDTDRRIRRIYAKTGQFDVSSISLNLEILSAGTEPGTIPENGLAPAARIFKFDGQNGLFYKTRDVETNPAGPTYPEITLDLTAPNISGGSLTILEVQPNKKLAFIAEAVDGIVLNKTGSNAEFKLGGPLNNPRNLDVQAKYTPSGGSEITPAWNIRNQAGARMATYENEGWALGENATVPSGSNGQSAVVIGKGAQAPESAPDVSANNAIVIGTNSGKSTGVAEPNSISIGVNANNDGAATVGRSSIALGNNTTTQGDNSVSIGTNVNSETQSNVLIGTGISSANKLKPFASVTNSIGIGFGVNKPRILLAQNDKSFINSTEGLVIGDEPQAGREDAILDLASTDKAVILPTVDNTNEGGITAIEGMMIYNSSLKKLRFYNGTAWETVTSS